MLEGGLQFAHGQYVIVDTGLPNGDGRTIKRAYSLLSADPVAGTFELAVRTVPGGPGSPFMVALRVGTELGFSGPWGKVGDAPG